MNIVDKIKAAPVRHNDYDWIYVTDLLPEDEYWRIRENQDSKRMLELFDDPEIVRVLYDKFSNAKIRSEKISSIYSFWQTAGSGYSLKPHEDSYPRVFTMTYYFAENDQTPEAGTSVYRVNKQDRTWETLATAPYVPNSAMIIAPYTDVTWHGVNLIEKDVDRQSCVVVYSDLEWTSEQLHYAEWKPGKNVNYTR